METTGQDAINRRQQRGLEIAARFRVRRTIGGWLVPSQSGAGRYTVINKNGPECPIPARLVPSRRRYRAGAGALADGQDLVAMRGKSSNYI